MESELKWRCVGILGFACVYLVRADCRSIASMIGVLLCNIIASNLFTMDILIFFGGALGEVNVVWSIFQAFSLTFCTIFLLDIKRIERTRSSSSCVAEISQLW